MLSDPKTRNPTLTLAASPAQIIDARALFREYAASLDFDLCFQSFDAEVANLPGDYAPPRGRLLLAYIDNEPAGCIALHAWSDKADVNEEICEMKRLYVRPQARGHNLGRRLIERILAEARAIGYTHMRLDTVRGAMDAAIALYRSYGFREIPPYRPNPQKGVLYFALEL